ncbi:MAG: DUF1311 domain-containing protein [Betaproteobacteria bacterium]|nr:DUF1311 domain-containing protein [Betaproteobacteria bacterium]
MRKLVALLALLAAAAPTMAQNAASAAQACQAFAEAEIRKSSTAAAVVRLDTDANLNLERYNRSLGSQQVSALLSGNGAVVYPQGVPVELGFVCLLSGEKRALFFNWTPRTEAPSLAQCRRMKETARCLDALLMDAEQELAMRHASLLVDARAQDVKAGNEAATGVFRRSSEAFLAYRTAECARRGADGSEPHKACLVDLTRKRGLDLR